MGYSSQFLLICCLASTVWAGTLMDSAGRLQLQSIPADLKSDSLVALISSPGTPSVLSPSTPETDVLKLTGDNVLVCRGSTMRGSSPAEKSALASCAVVASAIILDGITVGDVESGIINSRHAATLTTIFRARSSTAVASSEEDATRAQTLFLAVQGNVDDIDVDELKSQIESIYEAASLESKTGVSFESAYKVEIVSATTETDSSKILAIAMLAAKTEPANQTLAAALLDVDVLLKNATLTTTSLDTPLIASSFLAVRQASALQTRRVQGTVAKWRARVARGLLVDGFGAQATNLRQTVLQDFDQTTRDAAGISAVAQYRREQRQKLQQLVETSIRQTYAAQVDNLLALALKRLQASLLETTNNPAEEIVESNAQALRQESLTVETKLQDLQVVVLGLTQEKSMRELSSKLADAVMSFPDSPVAKIKRTAKVKTVVNKQKKPNQRSIDLGLDLVAMLRPDGFGNLQGYAGYQLGGNSITFGVHNDADDPQTIAQFGGVRPPLLRVQPKLRVDVEL